MQSSLSSKAPRSEVPSDREFHLVAAVQQLALCTDSAGIIEVLRVAARSLTSADGVTVVLREGELCHYVEENAVGPLWKGQRFPLESCISGWCMLNHQQVVIPDIYADARIPHDAYRPTFVRSLAMTPIGTRDSFGALGAYWAAEHVATAEEQRILQALAAAAACSVHNVQLVERLRAEARRKDEFLSLLAHELRNPLAPISNSLQLLRRSETSPLIGELRGIMERQLGQLVHLVDDLLDLSRINRGQLNLRRERVDLLQVACAAVETARPAIDAAGHRLSVELPPQSLFARGDATRLTQVLANLLHNAAKFTPPGGRIDLVLAQAGEEARFTVRDTGRGIAGDKLGEVFEMFAQVHEDARFLGGLGVGLSLARRLVELHGGRIQAASAGRDQGAQFSVHLPLVADAALRADDALREMSRKDGAKRVLVVDDNVDAARTLALLVDAMGHEVEVAHDGGAAVDLARQRPPALVFLDIAMPGMDGHEVARRLREMKQPMYIVALTGYGGDEARARSHAAGFDRHLVKPVDPGALESLLAAA